MQEEEEEEDMEGEEKEVEEEGKIHSFCSAKAVNHLLKIILLEVFLYFLFPLWQANVHASLNIRNFVAATQTSLSRFINKHYYNYYYHYHHCHY